MFRFCHNTQVTKSINLTSIKRQNTTQIQLMTKESMNLSFARQGYNFFYIINVGCIFKLNRKTVNTHPGGTLQSDMTYMSEMPVMRDKTASLNKITCHSLAVAIRYIV